MKVHMRKAMRVAAGLVVLAGVVVGAQSKPARPDIDLKGRLYRAAFISGPGTLNASDLVALPEPVQKRLTTFLDRRAAFSSAYDSKPEDADAVARDAKRRVIERAIVALIDGADIPRQAVQFVKDAPIAHEWLEYADGPLAEAAYAENVLKKDPGGPLAPFLYVFIAQRQRAAFEAAQRAKDEAGMKAMAKKYRAFIDRARAARDPIFGLLADDLDRVPYVNLKTDKHPRDFNPDA
jgi:hypothetical protein